MGGERRRRRLRRTGRTPFDAVPEPAREGDTDAEPATPAIPASTPEPDAATAAGIPVPDDAVRDDAGSGPDGATRDHPTGADRSTGEDRPTGADRSTGEDRRPRPDGGRPPRPNGRPGGRGPRPGPPQHRPSPADLADLSGPFALTAGVQDADLPPATPADPPHHEHRFEDPAGERGLRGLVGGGSSQVNVVAAMRARDASRPTDDDLAAAEADLPIVRRGWIPREDLPRPH